MAWSTPPIRIEYAQRLSRAIYINKYNPKGENIISPRVLRNGLHCPPPHSFSEDEWVFGPDRKCELGDGPPHECWADYFPPFICITAHGGRILGIGGHLER